MLKTREQLAYFQRSIVSLSAVGYRWSASFPFDVGALLQRSECDHLHGRRCGRGQTRGCYSLIAWLEDKNTEWVTFRHLATNWCSCWTSRSWTRFPCSYWATRKISLGPSTRGNLLRKCEYSSTFTDFYSNLFLTSKVMNSSSLQFCMIIPKWSIQNIEDALRRRKDILLCSHHW